MNKDFKLEYIPLLDNQCFNFFHFQNLIKTISHFVAKSEVNSCSQPFNKNSIVSFYACLISL